MPPAPALALILTLLPVLISPQTPGPIYCASQCADYISACYGPSANECYACSTALFQLNSSPFGVCALKQQHRVFFYELVGSGSAMDLTGYQSNSLSSVQCDQYELAGPYTAGNYLEKKFTGIPTNHYQVVIRLGLAYIGSWDQTDEITLTINGQPHTIPYRHCQVSTNLCNAYGHDCIRIINKVISHDGSDLNIRIESNIAETDTNIKFWGVKDIVVGGRMCHDRCVGCFGPSQNECLACAEGYFLWGNACVQKCMFLAVPAQRLCVEDCPMRFYQNDNRECLACETDCLVCSSGNVCQIWSADKETIVWEQNKLFFILLIVLGFLVILFIFYKLVLKKLWRNKDDENFQEINRNMISEADLQHAKQRKPTDNSSSSNSDEQKNSGSEENKNEYFDTKNVVFEEQGLNWAAEIPTVEQIIVTNESVEKKRKKKRFRPAEMAIGPASIEMDETIDNTKL